MTTGFIILSGGKSSRMGTDKALLPIQGKPNVERLLDELYRVVHEPNIVIVTNQPDKYHFLGEKITGDLHPGLGPLAGIQAGLAGLQCDWNVVVACDMPFVTAETIQFLVEQAEVGYKADTADAANGVDTADVVNWTDHSGSAVDAVVPEIYGQVHPLCAVYHKRIENKIEALIAAGQLRMKDFLQQLRVKWVTEKEFPSEIEVERVFFNMNRPEDWERANHFLRS